MADEIGQAVVGVLGLLIAVGVVAILAGFDSSSVANLLEQGIALVVLAGLAVGLVLAILR
jgi:hypothetical protein